MTAVVGSPIHDRGPVMQLHSGRAFYPLDPKPRDCRVTEIAASLSRQCRYAGHCRTFYSVAQHSVLVAQHMPKDGALEGLFHDGHEAFTGDITRPMKHVLDSIAPGAVNAMAEKIDAAIAQRFALDFAKWHDTIKEIDNRVLATERRDLMHHCIGGWDWGPMPEPYPEAIEAWSHERAEDRFLQMFFYLQDRR